MWSYCMLSPIVHSAVVLHLQDPLALVLWYSLRSTTAGLSVPGLGSAPGGGWLDQGGWILLHILSSAALVRQNGGDGMVNFLVIKL